MLLPVLIAACGAAPDTPPTPERVTVTVDAPAPIAARPTAPPVASSIATMVTAAPTAPPAPATMPDPTPASQPVPVPSATTPATPPAVVPTAPLATCDPANLPKLETWPGEGIPCPPVGTYDPVAKAFPSRGDTCLFWNPSGDGKTWDTAPNFGASQLVCSCTPGAYAQTEYQCEVRGL
jgi:Wiskott-Aldrich syndrome protein